MDYRSIIGELVLMKITLKLALDELTPIQNDAQTVILFNHAIGMPQKNGQVSRYSIMNRFYLIHCRSTNMSE